jgi:DNA-binding PadR family transcriptional regulator
VERGWVKLHRKIEENHFLMHDDNAYLLFTKLLLFVNSNGEYAVGRRVLGDRANMNPNTLYGVLVRLEREGLVTIESRKKYSIIRIVNWGRYQATNHKPNRLLTGVETKKPTARPTTTQPQPNHNPTMTQHLYKNRELRNKNKNSNLNFEKEKKTRLSEPIKLGEQFRALKNKKSSSDKNITKN